LIDTWNEVCVDVVAALVVVAGLKLHPRVVVWQDVGEPVLGPVARLKVQVINLFSLSVPGN
jgi:hypothetical protein